MANIQQEMTLFSRDYASCRRHFLQLAQSLELSGRYHVEIRCWPLASADEALALASDVLYVGQPYAPKVIILISGTHGVEGYAGSAVQLHLLQQIMHGQIKVPENTALLMLHALNPWGMQWARRCDQEGIDLNRNFIDFSQTPAVDPDYEKVLSCYQVADHAKRRGMLGKLRDDWGQARFDRLVSGGQYQFDWAPFYGGRQPAWAQSVIDGCIDHWLLAEREMLVIDLHTGLGDWSHGELISDHPAGSAANAFAEALFGDALAITEAGQSCSVAKLGLLDYRWHAMMEKEGCFLTLEFGTCGTESLFETLLDDHLFWRENPAPCMQDGAYQLNRARMLAHFCPADAAWCSAVLARAEDLFLRALGAST